MLYNLTFHTNNLTLPLAHQSKVQGMIYNLMSAAPQYSTFVHDCGFHVDRGAHFKLFVFSSLTGPHTIRNGGIIFPHEVSLALRTADPAFSQLLDAILQPGLVCFLGAQRIILARVQKETLRLDDDCRQLKIHPISPITVYRTLPNRHTYYYNPLDNEFSQLVNENYHRKWKSAVGELPKDSVELIALSVGRRDKVVTRVKGTIINAWGGTYLLKGNPRALEFLYHTGLGAKNSMGFGAFEILR